MFFFVSLDGVILQASKQKKLYLTNICSILVWIKWILSNIRLFLLQFHKFRVANGRKQTNYLENFVWLLNIFNNYILRVIKQILAMENKTGKIIINDLQNKARKY